MKLVNYKCTECSYEEEILYRDRERVRKVLVHVCPICGAELKKFNFKNNKQQWKFMDER